MSSCSICLESFDNIFLTRCGHKFCFDCINQWRSANSSTTCTCPMCRQPLGQAPRTVCSQPSRWHVTSEAEAATTVATRAASPPRRNPLASAVASSSGVAPGSVRARLEREHEDRQAARSRRMAFERRMDSYRASVFTPSGRPFESLPVVSLGGLKKVLADNRRAQAAERLTMFEMGR